MKICTRLAGWCSSAMCLLVATAAPARPHGQEALDAGLDPAVLARTHDAIGQATATKEEGGDVGPIHEQGDH